MPATLVLAITSTSAESASSTDRNPATIPRRSPGNRLTGSTRTPCPRFTSGYSSCARAAIAASSASAAPADLSGARRPIAVSQTARRSCNTDALCPRRGVAIIGIHTSGASTYGPWNPSPATPTIVNGCPLSTMVLSSTERLASKRSLQNRWLSTTTGAAPGTRSSSGRKKRPSAGRVSSTLKKS